MSQQKNNFDKGNLIKSVLWNIPVFIITLVVFYQLSLGTLNNGLVILMILTCIACSVLIIQQARKTMSFALAILLGLTPLYFLTIMLFILLSTN